MMQYCNGAILQFCLVWFGFLLFVCVSFSSRLHSVWSVECTAIGGEIVPVESRSTRSLMKPHGKIQGL